MLYIAPLQIRTKYDHTVRCASVAPTSEVSTSNKLLTTDTARQRVALFLKRPLITSLVKIGPLIQKLNSKHKRARAYIYTHKHTYYIYVCFPFYEGK